MTVPFNFLSAIFLSPVSLLFLCIHTGENHTHHNRERNRNQIVECGFCHRRDQKKYKGVKLHVYCIANHYFGETITVTGLLTATDILEQLKDKPLGDKLLLPGNLLKADEDIFLDDITLEEFQKTLQVPVDIVKSNGTDFFNAIMK